MLRKQNELLQVLKTSSEVQEPQEHIKLEENQTEFINEGDIFIAEEIIDDAKCIAEYVEEEMMESENCEEEQTSEEVIVEETVREEDFIDNETYNEVEEMESEDESDFLQTPQREELKYEKAKPFLVLTPNYLKAKDALKLLPSEDREEKPDYSTCVMIGDDVEKSYFICNNTKCSAELTSQEEMKLHMLDHKFDFGPQKCSQCPQMFKTRHFYEKHVESYHGEPIHICQICGKILESRIQLRSHLRNHDQTLKYKCNFAGCSKAFRVKHHLDNHMRAHTKESPFACDYEGCSARFRQKHALTIHMRKHNGKFVTCKECKSPFVTHFQLNKHLEKCNGTFRPLKTRAVSKIKNDSESSSEITFKCCVIDCNDSFKAKVTLEKHLKRKHQIDVKATTCILCCEEFGNPQALKSHQRYHLPFTCSFCSATFKTKSNYDNHMTKNHDKTEVRSHHCRECQASFKRAEHLRTHITNKHSSIRPFSCDSCSYQSKTRNDLNSHVKIHEIS